jgi:predicted nucleotidyltransferase
MDQTQIEKAIQALKKGLVSQFGSDVELRVFGSVAPGNYHKHSIDILVLLPGRGSGR